MNIVVATKEQLLIVRDLAFKIWPKAYGNIIAAGQIEYMLEMMYSIPSLEKQLQNNKIFLLAEEKNQIIGFASYELNVDNSNKTRIHKLYVLPEIQGKGIGKQLINYIATIALTNNNLAINLTVNKNNPAKILVRVYRLPYEDSETYKRSIDIISALNSQNKIKASDLHSTDPRQVMIENRINELAQRYKYHRKRTEGSKM